MHLVDEHDAVPVRSTDDLLSYFESAGKPASQWRVGTEHELIGVVRATGEAPPYDGPNGIAKLLAAILLAALAHRVETLENGDVFRGVCH